jgi:hypothetical protein
MIFLTVLLPNFQRQYLSRIYCYLEDISALTMKCALQ